MKRTIVYIDGYNLYYGLLKGTADKWLDLVAFSRRLLRDDHEIIAVKYFTSIVKTYPHDDLSVDRQRVYLQALSAQPLVTVKLGFYSKHETLAPALDPRCKVCDASIENRYVSVVKLEEKRTDVNIAVEMTLDAAKDNADCLCLITGDSDQVGTLEAVRYQFHKQVLVFNPHNSLSVMLKTAATYYKNIPRELPSLCHLPMVVPLGAKGRSVTCPVAWR